MSTRDQRQEQQTTRDQRGSDRQAQQSGRGDRREPSIDPRRDPRIVRHHDKIRWASAYERRRGESDG